MPESLSIEAIRPSFLMTWTKKMYNGSLFRSFDGHGNEIVSLLFVTMSQSCIHLQLISRSFLPSAVPAKLVCTSIESDLSVVILTCTASNKSIFPPCRRLVTYRR